MNQTNVQYVAGHHPVTSKLISLLETGKPRDQKWAIPKCKKINCHWWMLQSRSLNRLHTPITQDQLRL